jgi:hypothetical protein
MDPTFQWVSDPDSYRDTKQWRKNKNKTVKRNFEKKYTMKRTKNLEGDIPGRMSHGSQA